jgi:hypothetical protein
MPNKKPVISSPSDAGDSLFGLEGQLTSRSAIKDSLNEIEKNIMDIKNSESIDKSGYDNITYFYISLIELHKALWDAKNLEAFKKLEGINYQETKRKIGLVKEFSSDLHRKYDIMLQQQILDHAKNDVLLQERLLTHAGNDIKLAGSINYLTIILSFLTFILVGFEAAKEDPVLLLGYIKVDGKIISLIATILFIIMLIPLLNKFILNESKSFNAAKERLSNWWDPFRYKR